MVSIPEKCKIDGCNGIGHLKRGGTRYFPYGYCAKHNKRRYRGQDITGSTIFDHRPAAIEGDIAKIPLGVNAKDGYAIVDRADSVVDIHRWCITDTGYALGASSNMYLHHYIMGKPPKGMVVDHINRNKLDNRRSNLRFVTYSGNIRNSSPRKGTSIYKGVTKVQQANGVKYCAKIGIGRKTMYIGMFVDEKAAAMAYNEAAIKHFGEFAYLNKIP